MTNTQAPTFPPRPAAKPQRVYPDPNTKLGQAWQQAWDIMSDGALHDGKELAAKVAEAQELALATMLAVLARAATAGHLVRAKERKDGTRGPRIRTSFRRIVP